MSEGLQKIPEIALIREQARKLGLRVWFFGGTAASYAHYVKWDLLRKKGDRRFQAERFDYDYTNIFRSTQDLDIVVDSIDGKEDPQLEAHARHLEQALAREYPHLQGNKNAWEVRLLRHSMDGKSAILESPDFHNQLTDSHSTGLIELTAPPSGSPLVRDARDWNGTKPRFLGDVLEGKLHYYYSQRHFETSRFLAGLNPPIFSAIRYLTKAVQFELELRKEDLAQIQKIIRDFDPARDLKEAYTRGWIEKNGKKLIQNAVDVEYAVELLDRLGLRDKLRALGNPQEVESLSWWMSKEPLRTKELGSGTGRTAGELGIHTVAHETRSMLAYEAITRAHTGDPNVLISRQETVGEAAGFGNGFYTKVGRQGDAGTGLTIRFTVDPSAREGTDFIWIPNSQYAVWLNRAALRVIPESLQLSPIEYFRVLSHDGKSTTGNGDRALIEKLKRKLSVQLRSRSWVESLSTDEIKSFQEVALAHLREGGSAPFWDEWFSHPLWLRMPALLPEMLHNSRSVETIFMIAKTLDPIPGDPSFDVIHDSRNTEWVKEIRRAGLPAHVKAAILRIAKDPSTRSALLLPENSYKALRIWAAHPESLELSGWLSQQLQENFWTLGLPIAGAIRGQPHWEKALGKVSSIEVTPGAWLLRHLALSDVTEAGNWTVALEPFESEPELILSFDEEVKKYLFRSMLKGPRGARFFQGLWAKDPVGAFHLYSENLRYGHGPGYQEATKFLLDDGALYRTPGMIDHLISGRGWLWLTGSGKDWNLTAYQKQTGEEIRRKVLAQFIARLPIEESTLAYLKPENSVHRGIMDFMVYHLLHQSGWRDLPESVRFLEHNMEARMPPIASETPAVAHHFRALRELGPIADAWKPSFRKFIETSSRAKDAFLDLPARNAEERIYEEAGALPIETRSSSLERSFASCLKDALTQ